MEINAVNLLALFSWLTFASWILAGILTLKSLADQPELGNFHSHIKGPFPLVSILVPARNEADRILAASIGSMLAQDYGNFEVIAVNDWSTDGTGDILRGIARADRRLVVVDGSETPEGWIGKPWALQQALDASNGEWILATDADILFAPSALRTAYEHAVAGNYDALTLIPQVVCISFWERIFMPTFGWFMLMAIPPARINDPQRPEALGVGGFFLIRRSALTGAGEYQAVRDEVAEDLRMAEILKAKGYRLRVESAPDLIRTRMQTTLGEIWEGFTKNLFAGAKFHLGQALAGSAVVVTVAIAPFFIAVCSALLWLNGDARWFSVLLPALLTWLLQVLIFVRINFYTRVPPAYALFVPLGHILFVSILFNSALKIVSGSGVSWKGRTLYERQGVKPPRPAR
jgi:chlorobactene glucosyltransferase